MLISREKRRTNIAEYILYMWQVEDTIRAFDFDMERLARDLTDRYDQPPEVRQEIWEWYKNLASMMENEKVVQSGHLRFLKDLVAGLYDLHLQLLRQPSEADYSNLYQKILPLIREMDIRQDRTSENEIEICLNAVYILMMMRLKKIPVTSETAEAMNGFISFLALLSSKFRAREESQRLN